MDVYSRSGHFAHHSDSLPSPLRFTHACRSRYYCYTIQPLAHDIVSINASLATFPPHATTCLDSFPSLSLIPLSPSREVTLEAVEEALATSNATRLKRSRLAPRQQDRRLAFLSPSLSSALCQQDAVAPATWSPRPRSPSSSSTRRWSRRGRAQRPSTTSAAAVLATSSPSNPSEARTRAKTALTALRRTRQALAAISTHLVRCGEEAHSASSAGGHRRARVAIHLPTTSDHDSMALLISSKFIGGLLLSSTFLSKSVGASAARSYRPLLLSWTAWGSFHLASP